MNSAKRREPLCKPSCAPFDRTELTAPLRAANREGDRDADRAAGGVGHQPIGHTPPGHGCHGTVGHCSERTQLGGTTSPAQASLSKFANTRKHAGTGLEISWTTTADPAMLFASPMPVQGARAGTASTQRTLRAVAAAGSGGTTNVRFESNRSASQEASAHRHADERVNRCRRGGDGHGCAGVVGVVLGLASA